MIPHIIILHTSIMTNKRILDGWRTQAGNATQNTIVGDEVCHQGYYCR